MPIPTLPDVKAQLGINGSSEDALLALYLKAALRLVEDRVGPSSVTTFTEIINSHATSLLLTKRPVVSITSITPKTDTWPNVEVADVAFDSTAGTVWRTDLGTLAGVYEVVYTAGWTDWRENWCIAVLVTVQHMWRTQRGSSRRPTQGGVDALGGRASEPEALPPLARELTSDGIYYGGIA